MSGRKKGSGKRPGPHSVRRSAADDAADRKKARKGKRASREQEAAGKKAQAHDAGGAADQGRGTGTAGGDTAGQPQGPASLPAWRILLLAFAFAVWVGLAEEVPVLLAPLGHVLIRLSTDYVWMTPLADVMFFELVAVILIAAGWFWPRLRQRGVVVGVFAAMAVMAIGFLLERLYPLAVLALAAGVGIQAGRMASRPIRWRKWTPSAALVGLLLVLTMTGRMEWREHMWESTWRAWLPAARPGSPNVILLILDTVRGSSVDFVHGYGPSSQWPAVHTPVMDSLAARSLVFDRAIAPAPWTLPSHASMFTGQWPIRLWGDQNVGAEWRRGLNNRYPTVADVMSRAGYLTAGFVGNLTFAAGETGLGRGFLRYQDYPVNLGQTILSSSIGRRLAGSTRLRRLIGNHKVLNARTADDVVNEFLHWERRQTGHPFFAFLNFFDAHEPYYAPDSVRKAMPPGSHSDDYTHFAGLLTGAGAKRTDPWLMDKAEQAAHTAGYDAGILNIDRAIGRMLQGLRRRGQLDNTVIILASDHGEQLGEHRLYDHANSLYRHVLHVPLLIHDPRSNHVVGRVHQVVSLRDIAATILDMVGVNWKAVGIGGNSLARFWAGASEAAGERLTAAVPDTSPDTAFATLDRGAGNQPWFPAYWGPAMYSLMDSTYHYIANGDGSEALYDVPKDPAELHNLAYDPAYRPFIDHFRAELRSLTSRRLPTPTNAPVQHPSAPEPRSVAGTG